MSIRVLFVCHGNICRSPMAEFVMRDMVQKRGYGESVVIASAATSSEEIWNGKGNPVYPPARNVLGKHGLSCAGKEAQLLQPSDYDKYDLLIGMDAENMYEIERITRHQASDDGKIRRLLSFVGSADEVADPWYTGRFDQTYNEICSGCEALCDFLEDCGAVGNGNQAQSDTEALMRALKN